MDELGRQRERGELFLTASFAAIAALGAWLHAPLLTLFGVVGALSAAVLYLWQRTCLMRLSYRRTISATRVNFGESISVEMEITNDKVLPLPWVRVIDQLPRALAPRDEIAVDPADADPFAEPVPDDVTNYTQLFALLPFQIVARTLTFTCNRRGRQRFGSSTVVSGDPLGIRPRTMVLTEPAEVVVYPKIFRPLLPLLFSRTPLGDDRARRHLLGDGDVLHNMRRRVQYYVA